jgi:ribonuclease T2
MKIGIYLLGIASAVAAAGVFAQPRPASDHKGVPGDFDYYVLSLSWSPQHCASPAGERDTTQCGGGKQFGFVVHGLWPQLERGFPESCAPASPVLPATIKRMLPLMPSDRLIQHEWDRHGTCSGKSQTDYFKAIEKVASGIKVPAEYKSPIKEVYVAPTAIRRKFVAANPGLTDQSVKVLCGGRYLSEVRICLSKDFQPRPCSTSVRDTCRGNEIIMQPVR